MDNKNKGFTLPELLVVVLIMATLMGVAVPMWLNAQARSRAKACKANLQIIYSAEKEWALDNPDVAITNYTITVANIEPYIDGETVGNGQLDLTCESGGAYSPLSTIDASGNVPYPTCTYSATDPQHVLP